MRHALYAALVGATALASAAALCPDRDRGPAAGSRSGPAGGARGSSASSGRCAAAPLRAARRPLPPPRPRPGLRRRREQATAAPAPRPGPANICQEVVAFLRTPAPAPAAAAAPRPRRRPSRAPPRGGCRPQARRRAADRPGTAAGAVRVEPCRRAAARRRSRPRRRRRRRARTRTPPQTSGQSGPDPAGAARPEAAAGLAAGGRGPRPGGRHQGLPRRRAELRLAGVALPPASSRSRRCGSTCWRRRAEGPFGAPIPRRSSTPRQGLLGSQSTRLSIPDRAQREVWKPMTTDASEGARQASLLLLHR